MTLLFPLRYLRLENAYGRYLVRRDLVALALIVTLIAAPFILWPSSNYFHKDGFLDKISSFSAVLTGFYVAALIAVATLSSKFGELDDPITTGEVRLPSTKTVKGRLISRREYVCMMFGYMAFTSLVLAVLAIGVVVLSPLIGDMAFTVRSGALNLEVPHRFLRSVSILAFSVPIASLAVTTIRGLYYLVERLYAVSPHVDQDRQDEEL
ncbi:MAG TPA: hypothetical protein VF655_11560 [Allosphingosinicella sp.]|jgi:hypothetical protein